MIITQPLAVLSTRRCGHCKALAPHYEEAATALKEKNIKIAKVNCVDEAEFCQTNGIQGYPYVLHHDSNTASININVSTAALSVSTATGSTPTTLAPARLMASSAT